MTIFNTPILTKADVDAMNAALRSVGRQKYGGLLLDTEIAKIATYFNVTPGTVNRWLAPQGSTYRRCVPLNNSITQPTIRPGAVGKRVYCMDDEREGFEFAFDALRQRIFLCSALAMSNALGGGGFQRDPILHGDAHEDRKPYATIPEALKYLEKIWTGDQNDYSKAAWWRFDVFLDTGTDGRRRWVSLVTFNDLGADGSEIIYDDELDTDGEEIDCSPGDPPEEN